MSTDRSAPAGWYPDPEGLAPLRYWDGSSWLDPLPGGSTHSSNGTGAQTALAEGSGASGDRSNGRAVAYGQVIERWESVEHDNPVEQDKPVEHETPKPPPRLIRTETDAEEAATEWMRWMGFTDAARSPSGPDGGIDVISSAAVAQVTLHNEPALQVLYGAASGRRALFFSLESYTDEARSWGDRVGVALFRFDPQGEPEPTNCHAAALMQEALSRTAGHAAVPALLDQRPPVGVLAFPTLISDVRAVGIVRKQTQGLLIRKEVLAWIRQSWIILYRVRTDFTSKSGLRNELRFASSYQWFESISGQPFTLKAPRTVQLIQLADDAAAPIHARVPAAEVINATVKTWNTYCGLGDKKALKRHASMLNARGVPAHVAETINVDVESQVLLPVFVGLLTHSTGHRLVVLDGVAGRLQSGVAAGMTSNYRYVMAALDENRLVRFGTA